MNIAIAGYGVEGEANLRYYARDPQNQITILDENEHAFDDKQAPEGVLLRLGADAFNNLDDFDMVIRTAGLSPRKLKGAQKVWSATNEFFEKCPAEIVGITGTKGKGTTASLIASMLEASGRKVWLVGNIGLPAVDVLEKIQPDDIVVYELSSFQLWDLEKSPHTAVVLFIEPEHLNVHDDLHDYIEAKRRITQFQREDDTLVYYAGNTYADRIAHSSSARTIAYPSEETAHIQNESFYYGDQPLFSAASLRLPGLHNRENALAALNVAWLYSQDIVALEKGMNDFSGLPHRLAHVATVDGVDYYDDSIATTPSAAIAALRSFSARPRVIILGGSSKGADFSELADEMKAGDIRAILIGDEAPRIAESLKAHDFHDFEQCEPIAETFVARAHELAKPGSVVLLSPAAASFGAFKNYADRGDKFVAAVRSLAQQ